MSHVVFNRQRKIKQLNRAARTFSESDFLHTESANRLINQFETIIKKRFDRTLNISARTGYISQELLEKKITKQVFETEVTSAFYPYSQNDGFKILADEEFLPFKNESFDLVISNLGMHWVNDLPGCLIQIKRILKKGGFFCANLLGGKTLQELRHSLIMADEMRGEVSPRVSPFLDVKDGAALLQRTGFDEPVSVSEEVEVKYADLAELTADLKNTGENNALLKINSKFPGKDYFKRVNDIYNKSFSDNYGNINASFEIITISGWKR